MRPKPGRLESSSFDVLSLEVQRLPTRAWVRLAFGFRLSACAGRASEGHVRIAICVRLIVSIVIRGCKVVLVKISPKAVAVIGV